MFARASEVRTRRGRLDSLRRDILDLEQRAAMLPFSPLSPPPTPALLDDSRETPYEYDKLDPAGMVASSRAGGRGVNRTVAGFAEEAIMRDAETGVRLRPLRAKTENGGDGGSYESDSRVERVVGGAVGDGGHVGGESRQGLGVRRLWRWMRGSK